MPNLSEDYKQGDVKPVEIFARDKYPNYTYSTSSITKLNTVTLYNASYSLFDYQTNEPIVDYSKFTALSYDGQKNWFNFYFSTLPLNRSMYFGIKYEQNGMIHEDLMTKKTFVLRERG
jgi:hypothetical protein